MAVTQVRNRGSEGRAYYERKRLEGKTGKEARRCLKRRLSDVIYRQLIADQAGTIEGCGSPTTSGPIPPICTLPTSRSGPARPRPAPRPPGARRLHRARLARQSARRRWGPRCQHDPARRPSRSRRIHQL